MKHTKTIAAILSLTIVAANSMGVIPNDIFKTGQKQLTAYAYTENAAGTWIKDKKTGKWWYRHTDGSYTKNDWEKIDNKWYHFDANGWMQTGWLQIGGKWYYLSTSGEMQTGWKQIKGKWYYLNTNGEMHTGWLQDGEEWYYLDETTGAMVTGWVYIDGTKYYFNNSGVMQSVYPPRFIDNADNWSFSNSSANFGDTYYINSEYLRKLKEGLNRSEKELIDECVNYETWGGSCYGMATTSILASNGILNPNNWQSNASVLHDIAGPPTNDVKSLINYYFLVQLTDNIQQEIVSSLYENEKTKVNRLVSCLADGSPTLLCFFDLVEGGGHAIVAYDVEYGKYKVGGKNYTGKIVTYDNNSITYNAGCCLYFNSSDGSWAIPAYGLTSRNGGCLGLITDDLNLINYHGYIDGTSTYNNEDYIAILRSAPITGEYTVKKDFGRPGIYAFGEASNDDIKRFSAVAGDFTNNPVMYALKDTNAGYVVNLQNSEQLKLSLSYENSLLKANASSGSKAKFSPSDAVSISGDNTDYDLSIILNEGYEVTDWYSFSVKGSGVTDATLTKAENGYILEASNLNQVTAEAHNDDAAANITFSAEYSKVLLFEKDAYTIGIAVDTDNNGSFETEL